MNIPGFDAMGLFNALKVDPEMMNLQAAEALNQIAEIRKDFEELAEQVARTSTYWIGDGGDSFRKFHNQCKPEIETAITALQKDAENLYTMSGVYSQTEKEIQNIAVSLPDDAIM